LNSILMSGYRRSNVRVSAAAAHDRTAAVGCKRC
jgi:hypothetical protein